MPYPNILEQFSLMVNKYPHHTAFSQQGNLWSFEKLAHKTARLFNHIQSIKQDIPYQSYYIIFLEEVPEIVMAMLTVMNLQGVFILISPDTPRNRLTKILKSVHPKYVITSGKHNRLIESLLEEKELKHETILIDQIENSHLSIIPPYTTQNEDQLCYICFTSGSTGEPKSIAGSINALNHFMYWEKTTFEIHPQTRFSQLTHISFDAFLRDIFVPLTTGGTICLPPKKLSILSPSDVTQWLDKEKVEFIHTVPSHLRSLMSDPNLHLHPMSYLKYILLSGERIFPNDIKNWINFLGDGVQLVNLYGPSETIMIKFAYFLTKGDADKDNVPIGKPIEKTKALIINEQGLPCRQGQIGELVIRPPFKLFGYYFQDKNENSPFISNPFNDDPEDIIYKTGDFARLSDDGNYEFICRKDRQLKVRGMRIELGEIEHAIRQYVEVVNAVVIAINTQSNKEVEKIIACVIFKKPTEGKNPQLLMQFLQDSLPKYMIPNQVITYDEFPKLANGKVNYKAIEKKSFEHDK